MSGGICPVASAEVSGQMGAEGSLAFFVDLLTHPYFQCSACTSNWACSAPAKLPITQITLGKGSHLTVQDQKGEVVGFFPIQIFN